MKRKYLVVNKLTGLVCFHGRRFWTAKGATRKAYRSGLINFMELRRLV